MGQFSVSVLIERSQEDVFDFLSDPASLATWNSSFESAQWTSIDPPGVGSSYRAVGRILGARKESAFEVVAWERPHRYGYRATTRLGPMEGMETVVTLDPQDGGTRVTFDGRFQLIGALHLAERALGRLAEKQDGANLVAAKHLLEGRAPAGRISGFELSVVIDRPLEEVFPVLADLENDPRWRREWVEAHRTSEGPLGVGSTTCLVGTFIGWRTEVEYAVTEYEPNRVTAWRTVRGPLPLTFWRKVEQAERGTKVTIGYDAEVSGALRLVEPLAVSMGRRALAGDLPTLQHLLEARAL